MTLYLTHISQKYKHHVTLTTIGHSIENQPIHLIKINDQDSKNPVILLEAGAHGREWIGPAAILYIIETVAKLTSRFTSGKQVYLGAITPFPSRISYKQDAQLLGKTNVTSLIFIV